MQEAFLMIHLTQLLIAPCSSTPGPCYERSQEGPSWRTSHPSCRRCSYHLGGQSGEHWSAASYCSWTQDQISAVNRTIIYFRCLIICHLHISFGPILRSQVRTTALAVTLLVVRKMLSTLVESVTPRNTDEIICHLYITTLYITVETALN